VSIVPKGQAGSGRVAPASWLRRRFPQLVAMVALAWIALIIVLITINPVPGTGNPTD
jgi:hypothetical protein